MDKSNMIPSSPEEREMIEKEMQDSAETMLKLIELADIMGSKDDKIKGIRAGLAMFMVRMNMLSMRIRRGREFKEADIEDVKLQNLWPKSGDKGKETLN